MNIVASNPDNANAPWTKYPFAWTSLNVSINPTPKKKIKYPIYNAVPPNAISKGSPNKSTLDNIKDENITPTTHSAIKHKDAQFFLKKFM